MSQATIVAPVRVIVLGALLLAAGLANRTSALSLESPAFKPDGDIPAQFTCDGSKSAQSSGWADINAGTSPALNWQDVPSGTKAFALIVEDPDAHGGAPGAAWVHWMIYDIPATAQGLPEGVAKEETLSDGSKQGRNDFRNPYYQGPCPPHGDPAHHYVFTLYALDTRTDLPPSVSQTKLQQAMFKHILAKAVLAGTYKR